MEETRSSHRLAFTIGIVAVVLVLVRLIVGTPEEDSSLNRAAAAQLAAGNDDILLQPETDTAPEASVPTPAPPPPVDDDVAEVDAVPDEDLIDDASGSDPSELSEDAPEERRVGSSPSVTQSGPRVAVDHDHY